MVAQQPKIPWGCEALTSHHNALTNVGIESGSMIKTAALTRTNYFHSRIQVQHQLSTKYAHPMSKQLQTVSNRRNNTAQDIQHSYSKCIQAHTDDELFIIFGSWVSHFEIAMPSVNSHRQEDIPNLQRDLLLLSRKMDGRTKGDLSVYVVEVFQWFRQVT